MDENQHLQTPVSGDDDLAKALSDQSGMKFEETPLPTMVSDDSAQQPPTPQVTEPFKPQDSPMTNSWSDEQPASMPAPSDHSSSKGNDSLNKIKDEVVNEIKPLLGKLDLPAEEKFDTMLLVIRSTDDQSLLQATFDAAKEIKDESKRAKALLDVMREVSYFSSKK